MRFTLDTHSRWLAAAGTALLLSVSAPARAQSTEVSPTGKGITGGALLGAEAVMLVEAAFKVKPAWAYIVGGLAGGVGGGVGGYFAEQGGDAKLSLYLLAGGMALAIPTTVAVLSASAYEPPLDYTEDRGPVDEPVADPAAPSAKAPEAKPRQRVARRAPVAVPQLAPPPALVGVAEGSLALSLPAVEVRDVFSQTELHKFGLKQETEVRVPVLSYTF
ncbi:MAG: hypothetical protein KIT72_19420 [Polyangiaceae bacterium]|nr:hypothetical protein [Polyangiaceae bacterium]MCW5792591.1 hypothetical protein [Polyangiaceae bacterium]